MCYSIRSNIPFYRWRNKMLSVVCGLAVTWDQFDSCGIIFHPKIFSRLYFPIKIFRPRPDRILFRRPWIAVCSGPHQGKTKENIHINYLFKLFCEFSVSLSFIYFQIELKRRKDWEEKAVGRRHGEIPEGGIKSFKAFEIGYFPRIFAFLCDGIIIFQDNLGFENIFEIKISRIKTHQSQPNVGFHNLIFLILKRKKILI